MLREQFDDRFRRNQVEMDAPREGEKKRQRKQKYKFKARHGGVWGTVAEKIGKKNKKLRR